MDLSDNIKSKELLVKWLVSSPIDYNKFIDSLLFSIDNFDLNEYF